MINMNELAYTLASHKVTPEKVKESMGLLGEGIRSLTDDHEIHEILQGLIMVIVAGSFQQGYAKGKESRVK